jgi:transcriptional regulator with XRE-family HTH domain
MEKRMKITNALNDEAIQTELGKRLEQIRLERGFTQDALAERAGIGKRTIERLESGSSVQLTSLIRVLRVLELLDVIEQFLPEPSIRPMELLRLQGKKRQRAYAPRGSALKGSVSSPDTTAEPAPPGPWRWGDEA